MNNLQNKKDELEYENNKMIRCEGSSRIKKRERNVK